MRRSHLSGGILRTARHPRLTLPHNPKTPDGKPACCWCGTELKSKRRRWCGPACVEDYLIRKGHSKTVRPALYRRDRGRCSICQLNCRKLEALIEHLGQETYKVLASAYESARRALFLRLVSAGMGKLRGRRLKWKSSLWQADHVRPVCQGGGGCGLEGYRTLCVFCHKTETKRLHRTRKTPGQTFQPRPPDRRSIVHHARLAAAGRSHQYPRP